MGDIGRRGSEAEAGAKSLTPDQGTRHQLALSSRATAEPSPAHLWSPAAVRQNRHTLAAGQTETVAGRNGM